MKRGLFVTGTGTGIGKTIASSILLKLLRTEGINAVPMKPIQTGGEQNEIGQWYAPDLLFSLRVNNLELCEEEMGLANPYLYSKACSPHLAASLDHRPIDFSIISEAISKLLKQYSMVVVEGAGGVLVPLDAERMIIDLIQELDMPVVLVADSQLGTINHTLLTYEALISRGLSILGLIIIDRDSGAESDFVATDNVAVLQQRTGLPLLIRIPYLTDLTEESIGNLSLDFSQQGKGKEILQRLSQCEPDLAELRKLDHSHLWHPFTDINRFEESTDYTLIRRAKGSRLIDSHGGHLLDGISSWWCVNLGHGHKKIIKAIQSRYHQLQQCILGDLSHEDGLLLAKEIVDIAPNNLNHVFYASDGSSAVEASLKIALQYWWNRGIEGRSKFVYLENSYHGDTLGAVSVGFLDAFHSSLKSVVWKNHMADAPFTSNSSPQDRSRESWNEKSFASMESLLRANSKELAAVIVEPLCQAAGGMRIYDADYLRRLRSACDHYGVLLIADEIAVGFGRTGTMFACEQAEISPDILVLGKGLTSGFLPMSALAVTTEIYDSFRNDHNQPEKNRTFFHGHTYSGHPLAAACARSVIKIFREEGVLEGIPERHAILKEGFAEMANLIPNSHSNTLGMIGMLKVPVEGGGGDFASRTASISRSNGLFIRSLGDVLYLLPPLNISMDELTQMVEILKAGIVASKHLRSSMPLGSE